MPTALALPSSAAVANVNTIKHAKPTLRRARDAKSAQLLIPSPMKIRAAVLPQNERFRAPPVGRSRGLTAQLRDRKARRRSNRAFDRRPHINYRCGIYPQGARDTT